MLNSSKLMSWKTDEAKINNDGPGGEELEQSVKVNLFSKFKPENHMHIQQKYLKTSQFVKDLIKCLL